MLATETRMISGDSDEEIDRVEAIKNQIVATWERALKRLTFNLIDVFVR